MCLVFWKAFWEESHRRYYVKIEPKPGSERILEPAWRTLLRIHFWIFYVSGNFWPPSSMWFDLLCFRSGALSAAKTKWKMSVSGLFGICCCCCCWLLLLLAAGCWLLAAAGGCCFCCCCCCWYQIALKLAFPILSWLQISPRTGHIDT